MFLGRLWGTLKKMNRALVLALGLCTACGSEHALTVDLTSDLVAGLELGEVTLARMDSGGAEELMRLAVRADTPLRRGVRVARFEGLESGEYTLLARLFAPNGTRIAERRVVAVVEGETVFTMVFTRSCL